MVPKGNSEATCTFIMLINMEGSGMKGVPEIQIFLWPISVLLIKADLLSWFAKKSDRWVSLHLDITVKSWYGTL